MPKKKKKNIIYNDRSYKIIRIKEISFIKKKKNNLLLVHKIRVCFKTVVEHSGGTFVRVELIYLSLIGRLNQSQ